MRLYELTEQFLALQEPAHDLDDLAGKVMFGICAVFAGCVASALLAGM